MLPPQCGWPTMAANFIWSFQRYHTALRAASQATVRCAGISVHAHRLARNAALCEASLKPQFADTRRTSLHEFVSTTRVANFRLIYLSGHIYIGLRCRAGAVWRDRDDGKIAWKARDTRGPEGFRKLRVQRATGAHERRRAADQRLNASLLDTISADHRGCFTGESAKFNVAIASSDRGLSRLGQVRPHSRGLHGHVAVRLLRPSGELFVDDTTRPQKPKRVYSRLSLL